LQPAIAGRPYCTAVDVNSGVALDSFRALRYRMIDMLVNEEAISPMHNSTLDLDARETGISPLASGARSRIGHADGIAAGRRHRDTDMADNRILAIA
jgi:hypothetical protein